MKNKDKLLLGIGASAAASLSALAVVSCENTISQRINSAANQLGESDWVADSAKNWIAVTQEKTALDVLKLVYKNNKVDYDSIYNYINVTNLSALNETGTGKIVIDTIDVDWDYVRENIEKPSRLKIAFKVKKGDQVSNTKFVYVNNFGPMANQIGEIDVHQAMANFLPIAKKQTTWISAVKKEIETNESSTEKYFGGLNYSINNGKTKVVFSQRAANVGPNQVKLFIERPINDINVVTDENNNPEAKIEIKFTFKSGSYTGSKTETFTFASSYQHILNKMGEFKPTVNLEAAKNTLVTNVSINGQNNTTSISNLININITDTNEMEYSPQPPIGTPINKIVVYPKAYEISDSKENIPASVNVTFGFRVNNAEVESQTPITFNGFQSTGQNYEIEVDKQISNFNPSFKPNTQLQNLYVNDYADIYKIAQILNLNSQDYIFNENGIFDESRKSSLQLIIKNVEIKTNPNNDDPASINVTFAFKKGWCEKNKVITYNGFQSTGQKDTLDLANEINRLSGITFSANDKNNIFINDLTNMNLKEHTINLPDYFVSGNVPSVIANNSSNNFQLYATINQKNDTQDVHISASASVQFTLIKGTHRRNFQKTISGYISTGQQNQLDVNAKIENIKNWIFEPTALAHNNLPSVVTSSNIFDYVQVQGKKQEDIDNEISKKGFHLNISSLLANNASGTLSFSISVTKGQATSKTIQATVSSGFLTGSGQDLIDINDQISNLGELSIKGEAPFIDTVTRETVYQYVNGLPVSQNNTAIGQSGVIFNINSVVIKQLNGSDYESPTITINMDFSKGEQKRSISKDLSGFKTKKQYDLQQLNALISQVTSTPGENKAYTIANNSNQNTLVRPIEVNASNYKTYLTGIPTTNNYGVTVIVKNIRIKNNSIDNTKIVVTIDYSIRGTTETREYEVGGFASDIDYWQNQVENYSKQPFELQITQAGTSITVDYLSKNINQFDKYVSGLPGINNAIYVVVDSVSALDENTASINVVFKHDVGKLGQENITAITTINKVVAGFRTPQEQDQIDVNAATNKLFTLAINEQGAQTITANVDIENVKNYVVGFPETQNGIECIITGVSTKTNDDSTLIVKVKFRKNNSYSNEVIKEVVGFRPQSTQNQIDVDQAYENYKQLNLTVNSEGRNVLASSITPANVRDYVDGFPNDNEIQNGVKLNITNIYLSNTGKGIIIIFNFIKGGQSSKSVEVPVEGFRTAVEQDRIDVENVANGNYNPSVTEAGSKVNANAVTLDQLSKYVTGLPTDQNGVTVRPTAVKPATNTNNNNTLIVTVSFSKNGYSLTKNYNVIGFKMMTEQEIFVAKANEVQVSISKAGRELTGVEVINNGMDNFGNYVTFTNLKENKFNFRVESWFSFNNETELSATIIISNETNTMSHKITRTITGFVSSFSRGAQDYARLIGEASNITINTSKANLYLSREVYNGNVALNQIISNTIPTSTRLVTVTLNKYYSNRNKPNEASLNDRSMLLEWVINDIVNNTTTTIKTVIDNYFYDPYTHFNNLCNISNIRSVIWNKSQAIYGITNINQNNAWSNALTPNWQTTWVSWGYTDNWNHWLNNDDQWQRWMRDIWVPRYIKEIWNVENRYQIDSFTNIKGVSCQGYSERGWVDNQRVYALPSRATVTANVNGYPPKTGSFYISIWTMDRWWK